MWLATCKCFFFIVQVEIELISYCAHLVARERQVLSMYGGDQGWQKECKVQQINIGKFSASIDSSIDWQATMLLAKSMHISNMHLLTPHVLDVK